MILKGKIKSGLGEASFWMKKAEKVFLNKTGIKMFPRNFKCRTWKKLYFRRQFKSFTQRRIRRDTRSIFEGMRNFR